MILVDTSIWIDHLIHSDVDLYDLLMINKVCIHPFIIGEIACGNLRNRSEILNLLNALPKVQIATDEEVLILLENKKLYGLGLGYIDMHLIASAFLNNVKLFTRDKILIRVAKNLNIHK